jgi:hypothetical protein
MRSMKNSLSKARRCLFAGLTASGLLWTTLSASADLLAHESFAYPAGTIFGQNGGLGFNEAWQTAGGAKIATSGLTRTGLFTRGIAAVTDGDNLPVTRDLAANYGSVNGTNTVYLSFLARLDPANTVTVGPASGTYAGLSLFDRGDEKLFLGMPYEQANWGFDHSGSGVAASGTAVNGTTRLLVYRLDFTAANVTIRMYVDPTIGGAEPGTADAQRLGDPGFNFNRIRIQSGTPFDGPRADFDEIRIGSSYASVTSNSASPVVYEGFDYSSTRLIGQKGGYGFLAAWGGIPYVSAPGLSASTLQHTGNAVTTGGGHIGMIRFLTNAYGANNGANTIYVSFLARLSPANGQPIGAASGTYGGLSLFDNNDERAYFGMLYEDPNWGIARSGSAGESSATAVDTTPRLLVYRMDFSGTGTVDMRMYVDPTPGEIEPVVPAIQLLEQPEFSFNRIRIQSGMHIGGVRMDFDEIRVTTTYAEAVPAGVNVSGRLTFADIDSSAPPQLVTFEWRPTGGSAFTQTALVPANGNYTLTGVPSGSYQVNIQGERYLARNVSVNATGNVSGVNALQTAGDANGDNSVDVLDLDLLIQTFDSSANSPLYNPNPDFNRDGSVDVLDLDILIRSFDQVGDS